ncbi:peptidase S8/S53 domain-containing protein [Phyllosticta citribraziliensis]|uniref:Peptidase S8/S53 domain-containing protein n=1 Tax=Phyllosticta citribraziliensis TaxID=989973 RepID=A0ABR1L951_9PEZI
MRYLFFVAVLPLVSPARLLLPAPNAVVVPNRYIVTLKRNDTQSALQAAVRRIEESNIGHVYDVGEFRGFSATLDNATLWDLQNNNAVESIEPDTTFSTALFAVQNPANWNLARISHHNRSSSPKYIYDSSAGANTCVYIIDTGIYINHTDFQDRAFAIANFSPENDVDDNHGHGTHVAGTVGSAAYGVAKNASLLAVKVFGASGTGAASDVVAGIAFAANDYASVNRSQCAKGGVANLSISGPYTEALNAAVKAAVEKGLFMAVAAGNNGQNAANHSAGSVEEACAVGATDANDVRAWFSNFGPSLDIWAPGVGILSTWNTGPNATKTLDGTSMAAPHVAGLAAYLTALEGERSPIDLCKRIQQISTKDLVTNIDNTNSVNDLAYNNNEVC